MSKNLFITGTGTDVGKTYITGLVIKKLWQSGNDVAYYKAAMSGNRRCADGSLAPEDALRVKNISGIEQPVEHMCPYLYEAAASPHLASKAEGNPVELNHVLKTFDAVCRQHDYVTVEGAGGIVCPLRFDKQPILMQDFVTARCLPCLIVADAGLGAINAVVLTAEYMKLHQIAAKGIILNRFQPGNLLHEDNRLMCEALTGLCVLACVQDGDTELSLPVETLKGLYQEYTGVDAL